MFLLAREVICWRIFSENYPLERCCRLNNLAGSTIHRLIGVVMFPSPTPLTSHSVDRVGS